MALSNDELKRYTQQIKLDQIGIHGQLQLNNARVLCIGAGGLGSPLLLYLAAMGIGTLGIVDHDQIELSNLQRQVLYHTAQIGETKVSAAQQQLQALNPHIAIKTYPLKLTLENAAPIFGDYDIIADCSDNFSTRYLVNDVCKALHKPLVAAAIQQFTGQCMTFTAEGPCLRCVFPVEPQTNCITNCATAGVLGLLPGWFGIMQAMEVVKIILQIGKRQSGNMITFDMLNYAFSELTITRAPNCAVCAKQTVGVHHHARKITPPHEISSHELQTRLEQKEVIVLLDVRSESEHTLFNPGGELLPLEELPTRLAELNKDSFIVCYCHSGARSQLAVHTLLNAGFLHVKSLRGGITGWREDEQYIKD